MSKQRKANLNNVVVFYFCQPILLMSIGARDMMKNTNLLKIGIKLLILATPVCLNNKDFLIKLPFYQILKVTEFLEYFRLVLQQVNLDKFTKIINKTDIIFELTNRIACRTPYI
jgi:hypothetical protein